MQNQSKNNNPKSVGFFLLDTQDPALLGLFNDPVTSERSDDLDTDNYGVYKFGNVVPGNPEYIFSLN